MKKQVLCIVLTSLYFLPLEAQQRTGINTSNPAASLDIAAADPAQPAPAEGLLIPRVSAFPATNPGTAQNGLMLYLTATDGGNAPGLYCWNHPAGKWQLQGPARMEEMIRFYYPQSSGNPGANTPLYHSPQPGGLPSTKPATGIRNAGEIAPLASSFSGAITQATITITDAALLTGTAPTYPCYAFLSVFRNDFGNRRLLAVLRFSITAPQAGGGVGTNGSFNPNGLYHPELNGGATDGIYSADKLYLVQGSSLIEAAAIPVTGNWLLGTELVYPVNVAGNANAFISDAGTVVTLSLMTPYNRTVGGFKNVFLNLTLTEQ